MSFDVRSADDLVRIAAAGGGLILDAAARPTDELVRVAAAGAGKGVRLWFRGLEARPTDDLVQIAAAGKGCVQFQG